MCEAVPRVDVVVRRASPPRIIPMRASWSRALHPPARVDVHFASLAFFISFLLPFAVGHEGEGRCAGGRRGGWSDDTRVGAARAGRRRARGRRRGGARRGAQYHT